MEQMAIVNRMHFDPKVSMDDFSGELSLTKSIIMIQCNAYHFLQWYEVLQNISFENEFPVKKEALINSSMEYVTLYNSSQKQ